MPVGAGEEVHAAEHGGGAGTGVRIALHDVGGVGDEVEEEDEGGGGRGGGGGSAIKGVVEEGEGEVGLWGDGGAEGGGEGNGVEGPVADMVRVGEGVVGCEGESGVGAAEAPEDGASDAGEEIDGAGVVAGNKEVTGGGDGKGIDMAGGRG